LALRPNVCHKPISHTTQFRTECLPQSWDFIDSIATLTIDISVFGPLSVADALGVEASLRNKVVILSRSGAHHTELCVFPYWTSAGDPLPHLVRGFPVTADMRTMTAIQRSTHRVMAKSIDFHQVVIMSKHHITIRCLLHDPCQDREYFGQQDKKPGQ